MPCPGSGELGVSVDGVAHIDATIRLTRLNGSAAQGAATDGAIEQIGAVNVYGNVYESVADIVDPER
jgi:hypothetical protein